MGLVLPAATGIAPVLTPIAAVGLAITMAAAGLVHARRGEQSDIVKNRALGAAALFIAWGRFGPHSL